MQFPNGLGSDVCEELFLRPRQLDCAVERRAMGWETFLQLQSRSATLAPTRFCLLRPDWVRKRINSESEIILVGCICYTYRTVSYIVVQVRLDLGLD